MGQSRSGSAILKLAILWAGIFLLGSFWLTARSASDPVSLAVMPEAPQENEPVIATFKLNNPWPQTLVTQYQFYSNGQLLQEGTTAIDPATAKTYQYAYRNPLKLGERLNFIIKVEAEMGNYQKAVSSPPYPPQIWTSFVSFASFSTSVMSSMTTMVYYQNNFGPDADMAFNIGILVSLALIALLIFIELTQPLLQERTVATLGRLRIRFSTVTWILFMVFLGMVYTKVVMILSA